VFEFPGTRLLVVVPQMTGSEPVADGFKVKLITPHIGEKLFQTIYGVFPIVFPNKRDSLFACDFSVSDLMCGVRGASAHAEFEKAEEVVRVIQRIIERCIL